MLVLLLLLLLSTTLGFVLDVPSTQTRCVFDVLKEDMLFSGFYSVLVKNSPDSPQEDEETRSGVSITVLDPELILVFKAENAREGKFTFIAKSEGKHQVCVKNVHLLPRRVELKLKSGVEAKDLSEVAQRDHLMPLAVELLRLEEVAAEIRQELRYLFQAELDMREVNSETKFRVKMSTAFSLVVIVSTGVWQYFKVKAYLASKKVTS